MLVGQTIGQGAYRFEIAREIGSGAMGTVYRATFYKNGEVFDVALKVIALGLLGNESAMARFDREASILKQLRHKHIVRLQATGHYRKTPFIAMEFVDGEPLDRILARRGKLSWEQVVSHAKHLCEALQYAHDKGIIHRDLKPSNLMIASDGVLKLTDFGIAKDTDVTALTGANSTIGTAAYMSPEQCKGDKNLTHKSDLYSLGIVLFELLTGRKPFTADTTVDMFLKHVNEPPPRLGKIVPDLPQKFESLILQLLEKDKEHRPTDAAWVARMLTEVEEDIFARKSAGLDAANARRIDRRRGDDKSFDEADRDAARALKGIKKKKKKKSAVPWRQRKSTKAAAILAALSGIVLAVYLAVRPPSAEKLAARIDPDRPEASLAAAEEYLKAYGDKPGENTDKAARVFRDAKVREREKQLVKRFGVVKWRDDPDGDDPNAYTLAMSAIQAEKDGRLANALNLWNQVKAVFPEEGKLPYAFEEDRLRKARWGWIADRRIRDIDDARKKDVNLDAFIAASRNNEKPIPFDPSSARSLAVRARRLEQIGDPEKANRTWETLQGLPDKEPDSTAWLLLASEHRSKLKESSVQRTEMLARFIQAANAKLVQLQKKKDATALEWKEVRMSCRDLIELYDDETEKPIQEAVTSAKRILADATKS
jgi:eukaryotic-like serine/threonine-protein kinase